MLQTNTLKRSRGTVVEVYLYYKLSDKCLLGRGSIQCQNYLLVQILPIRLDSADYVERNTKSQPRFSVDLYGQIYVVSNSIKVPYYWKPNINIIHTKRKCIQSTRTLPLKKEKKNIFYLKQERRENRKRDKVEKF